MTSSDRASVPPKDIHNLSAWGSERKLMENANGSDRSWFEKEKAVYYKVFWLAPAMLCFLWLVENLFSFSWFQLSPVADVGVVLVFFGPYFMIFASGIFTFWGACVIYLGLWQKARLRVLTFATFASSLPLLLFLWTLIRELVRAGPYLLAFTVINSLALHTILA